MKKIAAGPEAKSAIDLQAPAADNIHSAAKALGKKPENMTVGVLKRSRHDGLTADIRRAGARVRLAGDGDVALALEAAGDSPDLDLLMGTGGAPEGVLAAAALKCLGGGFQGQLVFKNEGEERRAREAGVEDLRKIRSLEDLASGNVFFCATAVTSGFFRDSFFEGAGLSGCLAGGKGAGSSSLILTAQEEPPAAGRPAPPRRSKFILKRMTY